MKRSIHWPIGGASLVELLIALFLGNLLIFGASRLFVRAGETHRLLEGHFQMQENARFALDFITDALRHAGYFGCNSDAKFNTLRGDWPEIFEFNIRVPLAGVTVDSGTFWSGLLPISKPSDNGLTYLRGRGLKASIHGQSGLKKTSGLLQSDSDILVTRRISSTLFRLAKPTDNSNPVILMHDQNGDGKIKKEDLNNFHVSKKNDPILMLGDCQKSAVFRATKITTKGHHATLESQVQSGNNLFQNVRNLTGELNEDYGYDTYAGGVQTEVFYVATGAGLNNRQQPVLSLWRKQGTFAPQELVVGIERLKIFLGVDTDNDQIPNRYAPLTEMEDFNRVVTLQIFLLASSVNAVYFNVPSEQGILRRVFTQTVYLRNL